MRKTLEESFEYNRFIDYDFETKHAPKGDSKRGKSRLVTAIGLLGVLGLGGYFIGASIRKDNKADKLLREELRRETGRIAYVDGEYLKIIRVDVAP